jgi:hypothetical protein
MFIDLWKTYNDRFGYNICPIAKNSLGTKHTEETKRKLREKSTGRKQSEETIQKKARKTCRQKTQ